MNPVALDLNHAYSQNHLPADGGVIISGFFRKDKATARFELIGIPALAAVSLEPGGYLFRANGIKLVCAIATHRADKNSLPAAAILLCQPLQQSELTTQTLSDGSALMLPCDPILLYGSFFIEIVPAGDFTFFFFKNESLEKNLLAFLEKTLSLELLLADKPAGEIIHSLEERMHQAWQGIL